MKTSKAGIDLIKKFEGYRAKAYICPAGVLTIGYGHTKGVKAGMIITEPEAERLLQSDQESAEKTVTRELPDITQYQFDALVSFVFNLGAGNLKASTLRRRVNEGRWDDVPSELRKWVKGGGKILRGLVLRREAEVALV